MSRQEVREKLRVLIVRVEPGLDMLDRELCNITVDAAIDGANFPPEPVASGPDRHGSIEQVALYFEIANFFLALYPILKEEGVDAWHSLSVLLGKPGELVELDKRVAEAQAKIDEINRAVLERLKRRRSGR